MFWFLTPSNSQKLTALTYNIIYSLNRPLKGVCGMTRETIIGIVTTIESQEHRRREQHRPVEHPRAGDTNDSELLFSIFREHNRGMAYTLKTFQFTWGPLCR